MKITKLILASGASLLAMTSYANADFIITPIAFTLFSGSLGGVLSFSAIYTGLQIAAYAAVVGAQLLLAGGARQQRIDPGEAKNTFQEAESSEINAIGRVRLGGLKAFGNTSGNHIYRLIWHSRGPLVAIEEYFLGGYEVTVEADGQVSSPPWSTPSGSFANISSKIGDGNETAWPGLMAAFPALWTANHRCRGIFQSLVRFAVPDMSNEHGNKRFQKLYQGGAPDLEVTARVSNIFDPRDPAQDADNPATWTWSDNGVLCAVHIMRRYPGLNSSDFDWDFIASEASRADASVVTRTGTEPRARCWGVWPSEAQRGDVMQQVLDSIGAEIVLSDEGLIRIRLIEDDPDPEISFQEDSHITEVEWKSGPEAVERPNVCRVKYYSPERGFEMSEIDMTGIAWAHVESEIARYGEKVFDVELPFCPSAAQAQRIARRLFLLARGDAGAARMNMAGMAAWGVTFATIQDGEDEMLCRISSPRIDDESGVVDIPYVVWPQELIDDPWEPATMEALPPIPAPILQRESSLPTPAQPVEFAQVQYGDSSREIRIRFIGVTGGVIAEATRRSYVAGNPTAWASMTEYGGSADNWLAYAPADYVGLDADFRVRFFDSEDEGSYWSALLQARPVFINNGQPQAPSVSDSVVGGDYRLAVTFPELRARSIRVEYSYGLLPPVILEQPVARPDVEYTFSLGMADPGTSINWSVVTLTSNGTTSVAATGSYIVPV